MMIGAWIISILIAIFTIYLIVDCVLNKNCKKIKWELWAEQREKKDIENKLMKAESEKRKLESENQSLLNILENEGFSEAVKYNPYLNKYEKCWCKK